jgi:hypothetical protein
LPSKKLVPKCGDVSGNWRKLHFEKFMYVLPIRYDNEIMKMGCAGHVVCVGEKRSAYLK